MVQFRKTDWALGAGLIIGLVVFALAPSSSIGSALAALACAGLVIIHILLGDEVERARSFRAAGLAFALCTATLIGLTALGRAWLVASYADQLWAFAFVAYLISWTGLRVLRA